MTDTQNTQNTQHLSLRLADDYIMLERIDDATASGIHLLSPRPALVVRARVLGVGPGELRANPVQRYEAAPSLSTDDGTAHAESGSDAVAGLSALSVTVDLRYPMPCDVGDIVLVPAGAGIQWEEPNGQKFWFVYAMRKDIIGVVQS